jgi:alpha-glucoside transport system substrate-binding protein
MVYAGDLAAIAEGGGKTREDARFFDFPAIRHSHVVLAGGDIAVMLKDAPVAPAAVDLMKFLASPKAAAVWLKLGGFISPNDRVNQDNPPTDPVIRQESAALTNAQIRFDLSDEMPPEFGSTPRRGMWLSMQEFLSDPSDSERASRILKVRAREARDDCSLY